VTELALMKFDDGRKCAESRVARKAMPNKEISVESELSERCMTGRGSESRPELLASRKKRRSATSDFVIVFAHERSASPEITKRRQRPMRSAHGSRSRIASD
jgi:hypothetical protein